MTLRDVTGRVCRWTLIFHRDEQGFAKRLPKLDRGRVDPQHRLCKLPRLAARRRSETRKCATCAIEEFDARP